MNRYSIFLVIAVSQCIMYFFLGNADRRVDICFGAMLALVLHYYFSKK